MMIVQWFRRAWQFSVLLVLGLGISAALISAQETTGGRFCVRAFEDLNANETRDPGEPLITTGVIINLQNASGVVIASAQMDDPTNETRAQGLYCFGKLPAGQYSVMVTSATFSPTTPDNLTASIAPGDLPALLEYGAQRRIISATQTPTTADDYDAESALERVLVALGGALGAMLFVALFGVALYWALLRDRSPRPSKNQSPTDPDAPFKRPG